MGYDQDILAAYNRYASGKMDENQIKAYKGYIQSGALELPPGKTLELPKFASSNQNGTAVNAKGLPVSAESLNAYKSGTMSTQDRLTFENALISGDLVVPQNLKSKGALERLKDVDIFGAIKEIPGAISEQFTGEKRTTPEIEALPDWSTMPEMNSFSLEAIKNVLGTMVTDPEEAAKTIASNSPGSSARKDEKGNIIFTSAKDGKEYAIKPGFKASDIPRTISSMVIYGLGGRGKGFKSTAGRAAAVQTGIEASQAALGGDFDPEQIPLAAVTEIGGELAGKAIKKGAKKLFTGLTNIPTGKGAEELIETAAKSERAGITPMTSDLVPPESFIGKTVQSAGERVPFIGTGPRRVGQQAERVEAIRSVMREFGADELIAPTDDIMKDLLKKHSKDIQKYSGMKKEVIARLSETVEPGTAVGTSKTTKSINQTIEKIKRLDAPGAEAEIQFLERFKNSFTGKSLDDLESLRKSFGENIKNSDFSTIKSDQDTYIKTIYNSLRDDMGDFIKANGERRDFLKWKTANRRLELDIREMNQTALKSVIKKGSAEPEVVKNLLFKQTPSRIRLLYKNLTPQGRKNAKVAILQKAAEKAGGIENMTTAKFYTNLNKLRDSTGVFFSREDKQVLKGMMSALKLTKRAEISGLTPPTGVQVAPIATGGVLAYMLGGPKATAAVVGIGAVASLYESRPVRNALLKMAAAKPGKEKAAMEVLTKALQATRQLQSFKEDK